MSDIELVIKIPEEMYKNIQSETFWLESGLTLSNAYDFIKNGTPIPKGHGDLVDRNDLLTELYVDDDYANEMKAWLHSRDKRLLQEIREEIAQIKATKIYSTIDLKDMVLEILDRHIKGKGDV